MFDLEGLSCKCLKGSDILARPHPLYLIYFQLPRPRQNKDGVTRCHHCDDYMDSSLHFVLFQIHPVLVMEINANILVHTENKYFVNYYCAIL